MITVFYLLVAVCLFVEILRLLAVKKVDQGVKKYKGVKDPKDYSPLYTAYVSFGFFYFFFCLVGLMSSQWIGFVALLLLGFVSKKWITWRVIDGILSIAILVFILLNKFQFHINFNHLLINYLSV